MTGPLVVVGDALLDVDVHGRSDRQSPEAPVPVLDVEVQRHRPGGAGLAALLAAGDHADVVLVTALADDDAGRTLAGLLRRRVEVVPLALDGGTPTKTRLHTHRAPTLRVDQGTGRAAGPLPLSVRQALSGAGAVLVSDYGRGVAALPDLRAALAALGSRVPVVWDPHPRGAAPVAGSTLVTPNESEAAAALGGPGGDPPERGRRLRERWACGAVVVTSGAAGAVLTTEAATTTIPVPPDARPAPGRPVDTCGAGDQFAAATALAYLAGATDADAVSAGVAAASAFVRDGAAGRISSDAATASYRGRDPYAIADSLHRTGGTLVATGGCFDLLHRGHVSLLAQARALGDALVVCLNSDASVRRAKGPSRPLVDQHDRAAMLQSLAAVDGVVIFDEETPAQVLDRLRPAIWVKGGDYAGIDLPEAEVVRGHGGSVVLLPTVHGYSTSRLVSTLAAHASAQETT